MQKKFLTNLVLVLVLNALVKPFYIIGIDAEILKQVEASDPGSYGEYFSLLGVTFILNIFLDLGITNYNTRNIAQNNNLLKKHFSGILALRGILSVGYMLLIICSSFFLGYSEHQFEILAILAVNQILVSFILYFRSNLAGLLLFKQDSLVSILDRVLLISICSALLWGGLTDQHFKIEWFIYAQTFSYALTAVIAFLLVLRRTGKIKFTFDRDFSWMIIKKSWPYALLIFLMMANYKADGVMLERMLPNGSEEAAVYARGYRFFEALNMVGYLFAGLLLPIFSKLLKQNESIQQILYFSLKLMLAFSITCGFIGFFFQEDIIHWRFDSFGDELINASLSFGMLMIGFIFITTTYIFGTLLTANGNLKSLNIVISIGVVLNIGLNLYLIPEKGAYGAAIASMITQGFTASLQVYLAFRILKIKVEWNQFTRIIVFAVLIIPTVYYSQLLELSWSINLIISLLISTLVAFSTGMVSIKGIVKILKE